uniref:Protein NLRC3-like n=1 Tax=Phallusia mammillata TaxID=59560 RepID=A0A6F9DMZ0_9ASCI|nr:protein NLRC3-like [Phallusia mammillata]
MGSNLSKNQRRHQTAKEIDTVPNIANTNLQQDLHAENVFLGEVHQHIYPPEALDIDAIERRLKAELKEKNERIFGCLDEHPIPLDVIREYEPRLEKFGAPSAWEYELPIHSKYEINDLLPSAQHNASAESWSYAKTESSRHEYVKKHGNVVGVIGAAGIGKTTLAKIHLRQTVQNNPDAFIFHMSLKDLDYSKEISVLEFLLRSSHPQWEHSPETDSALLKKISNSETVFIIMDGLDEAKIDDIDLKVPTVGLFNNSKPHHILMNLLNGNLLSNTFKWIVSRPGAYYDLHPDYKPHFTARVVGLGHASQRLFCNTFCTDDKDNRKLQNKLDQVPAVRAVCTIPMFCSLMIPYALKQLHKNKATISLTGSFASAFSDCIRSDHFKGKLLDVRMLTKLALNGIINDQFVFSAVDFEGYGFDLNAMETFLSLKVTANQNMRIFTGDKIYFFSHLTWQEFLAAMHLMFVASVSELESLLKHFTEPRWEFVFRFVLGFFDESVYHKISKFFPNSSKDDMSSKKVLLKNIVEKMAHQYAENGVFDYPRPLHEAYTSFELLNKNKFINRPANTTLFKLCALAMESNNAELTKTVASSLPDTILISNFISHSDVASLCHVLCATKRAISINVGALYKYATFTGDSLTSFLSAISTTNHKIAKFHVRSSSVGIKDFSFLKKYLDTVEELSFRQCSTETGVMTKIIDCIERRKTPLGFMDFTSMGLSAQSLSRCIGHVERIEHHSSRIDSNGMKHVVAKLKNLKEPIKWLDIGQNNLGTEAAVQLAPCVDKIEMLWLHQSMIDYEGGFEPVFTAIENLKTPMQLLTIGANRIGLKGISSVAKCLHNILRLKMYYCMIRAAGVEILARAIAALKEPMKELNIGNNPIGTDGIRSLCDCVHNIEALNLYDCALTDSDLEMLLKQILKLEKPMKWLCLGRNNLGDDSAGLLARSLHMFENIWVEKLCFSDEGIQTIKDALQLDENQLCKVHGLDGEC